MFTLDLNKKTLEVVDYIKTTFEKEGKTDATIAVSGGVDSATSLSLTTKALGKKHVFPVILPYGKLNLEGKEDALLIIEALSIPSANVTTVDIQPFVDSVVNFDPSSDQEEKGRIMARTRMIILYHLAQKRNSFVVGTENKSEHLLAYYTRFGDEASDVEPIRQLYKTQVFALAKHLGVPEKILKKSPSAGLWENQTDEGQFGFSYKTADEILFLYEEKKLSKEEVISKGYDKNTVEKVWWWIKRGEFKARLPYIL